VELITHEPTDRIHDLQAERIHQDRRRRGDRAVKDLEEGAHRR